MGGQLQPEFQSSLVIMIAWRFASNVISVYHRILLSLNILAAYRRYETTLIISTTINKSLVEIGMVNGVLPIELKATVEPTKILD